MAQGLDNARAEDPVIWYSGGYYHITVNWWDSRKARHLMSKDGVHDWKDIGVAYDPTSDFIRYTDGTINHWYNLDRPGVVMENGHVVAFTFAATDINKSSVTSSDNHGSKTVVVPFDAVAFAADFGDEPSAGGGGGRFGQKEGDAHGAKMATRLSALTAYNAKIPEIIESQAAKGQHMISVDMSKLPTGSLSDGTHPNDQGYADMANIWYAAIKDLLPNVDQ